MLSMYTMVVNFLYLVEADFFSLTLLQISKFGHHVSDGYLCIQQYEMEMIFLRRKRFNKNMP